MLSPPPRDWPPVHTSLSRRVRNVVLVVIVLAVQLAGSVVIAPAAQAFALPPALTSPAGVITKVVGDLLPESGAARAAGMALSNGANGAINTGVVGNVISVAKFVPGFKVGYKAGEWVSTALGLYEPIPQAVDPGFVPYEGYVPADTGWTSGDQPFVFAAYTTTTGQVRCTPIAGLVAGQVFSTSSPAVMRCELLGPEKNAYVPFGGFGDGTFRATWGGNANCSGCPNEYEGGFQQSFTSSGQPNEGRYRTSGSGFIAPGNDLGTVLVVPSGLYKDGGYRVPDYVQFPVSSVQGAPQATRYYFPGGQDHPPLADATPERKLRTTALCQVVAGQPPETHYYYSDGFEETAPEFPAPRTAVCLSGFLIGSSVDLVDAVDVAQVVKHLSDWTSPDERTDWAAENPNCWDGNCAVTLEQLKGGSWTDCFTDSAGCEHWFDEADKDSRFRCMQNGKQLALSDCNYYSPSFDPAKLDQGIQYGDPATGATPKPSTTPMDSSARQPLGVTLPQAVAIENGTTPAPGGGTTPAPGTGGAGFPTGGTNTAPAGTPSGAADGGPSCFGDAWSWNPLSWVFIPVKCVLIWAFVPDPGVVPATLQSTWATVSTRPPVSFALPLIAGVSSFVGTVVNGCSGNIAEFSNGLIIPCEPPAGIKPYVTVFRIFLMVLIFGIMAFDVFRHVEKMVAR